MTQHSEFDATAILTIPKPYKGADTEQGLLIHNRPDLFTLIRDKEGVDIHVEGRR